MKNKVLFAISKNKHGQIKKYYKYKNSTRIEITTNKKDK